MRTCMSYLDYINKKHNKERKTQERRNKISGFVLLTLVFLMIFGLGLIMFYCLTDALAHILKKSYVKPNSYEPNNKNISTHLDKISNYSASKLKNRDLFSLKLVGTGEQTTTVQLDSIVQREIRLEAEYFTESLFEKLSKRIEITYEKQNLIKLQDIVVNLVLIMFNSNRLTSDENTEQHYFKYIDEIDQGFKNENNC
jgi:type II secretory pathway component PulL